MTHIKADNRGPARTRRDTFTAIGVAMMSAAALASPFAGSEAVRGPTNNRDAAKDAYPGAIPFVMSF